MPPPSTHTPNKPDNIKTITEEIEIPRRNQSKKQQPLKKTKQIGHVLAKATDEEDKHILELDNKSATIPITAHWKNSPTRVAASYAFTQTFTIESMLTTTVDPKEKVPSKYHKYLNLFSKAALDRLPQHKPYDYAINLIDNPKMSQSKCYPLSPAEQKELDKFIDKNLKKGYIRPSKSPYSSPFFFVWKKDSTLTPVQDYRKLNKNTVKNCYPLPLIPELVDHLKGAKIFTKLDL